MARVGRARAARRRPGDRRRPAGLQAAGPGRRRDGAGASAAARRRSRSSSDWTGAEPPRRACAGGRHARGRRAGPPRSSPAGDRHRRTLVGELHGSSEAIGRAGGGPDRGARALLRRHALLRGPVRARARGVGPVWSNEPLRAGPGPTRSRRGARAARPRRRGVHPRPAAPDDRPGDPAGAAARGRRRTRRSRSCCSTSSSDYGAHADPAGQLAPVCADVMAERRPAGRRLRARHRGAIRRATPRSGPAGGGRLPRGGDQRPGRRARARGAGAAPIGTRRRSGHEP